MAAKPFRYVSSDEDSGRWIDFPFRQGDIVISTRSKSGTTWVQMICALLVFGAAELPEPLGRLSPWLDHLIEPRESVITRLERQGRRRIIKTHTPLDGVPIDRRAHYLVIARHPLDMAVSLYHQGDNIDRERLALLTGTKAPERTVRPDVRTWLTWWIAADRDPRKDPDMLPGVMWHLSDAWGRRHEPNVTLLHYDDLCADLEGQMRLLAKELDIDVDDGAWPALVHAAGFEQMRANATYLVPNGGGVLKDDGAFFRRGRSGAGRELLTEQELADYYTRVQSLGPPDLVRWLHRESTGRAGS